MYRRSQVKSGFTRAGIPRPKAESPGPRSGAARSFLARPAGWILFAAALAMPGPGGCKTVTVVETPAPPALVATPAPLLNSLGSNWSDVVENAQYFSRHVTTDPRTIAALIQALEVDGIREFVLREAAARALGLAGDLSAVPSLRRRLEEDPDEDVRKAAAHAFGALKAKDAGPSLLARVLDPAEAHWVTAEAAAALGEIGDLSVISALEAFRTEHADFWMEDQALDEALAKLRAAKEP